MALSLRPNLRFEQLEEKKLLAGDVTVAVVDGALLIEGDDVGNQIAVSSGEAPGEFLIRGLDGTVVHLANNAQPDNTSPAEGASPEQGLLVSGVRRGIHIAMNDGDDSVVLHDAAVRGNVTINTGEGADHVSVGLPPESDPGPVPANAVQATDGLPAGVSIGESLLIRTGAGDDTVLLGGRPQGDTTGASLRVRGRIAVGLGAGEDHLAIDAVHARRAIAANGGEGSDWIDVVNTQTRFLALDGGDGQYADSVSLHNVYAAMGGIATGDGDDQVEIADSAFGMLGVRAGGGNDTVAIGGTRARLAILLGGEGPEDTWNDLGDNHFGRLVARGFELPEPVIEDPSAGEPV